jgi:flagellar basal-body rod modification protein FlgD
MQATNLIGHGVLVEGSNVTLSGGKSIIGVELGSAADNVQVVITDPQDRQGSRRPSTWARRRPA